MLHIMEPYSELSVLNPIEEHYLKREVLKFQLEKEFDMLNDIYALRRFGFPFSSTGPQAGQKSPSKHEHDTKIDVETEFPMLQFMLENIIMKFPLLSGKLTSDKSFWQTKVQAFFEHFMSLGFSDSFDREEISKRRKTASKLKKVILLLFNSGISAKQEVQYFTQDKPELETDAARQRSKVEEFAIPTSEDLHTLTTGMPEFINGWSIDIISVFDKNENRNYSESLPEGIDQTESDKPKTTNSSWIKMSSNMISRSSTNLFAKLSLKEPKRITKSKRCFLIKVQKEGFKEAFYIAKTHHDFKKLSHSLKKEYPGLDLPRLPQKSKKSIHIERSSILTPSSFLSPSSPKEKTIKAFDQSLEMHPGSFSPESMSIMSDESSDDHESNMDLSPTTGARKPGTEPTYILKNEITRTALRQHLRSLCKEKQVSESIILETFFATDIMSADEFTETIIQDIRYREALDITNLQNQVQFQKLALEKSMQLQDSMNVFKEAFLKDKNFILSLVEEIKEKESVKQLSKLPFDFIEWCKVYLSSTIYQLFLGNDNSYELFEQVKRLHRLMPYTMMAHVMRLTNPMAIMKGIMDLFMAQPFGRASLLQTMFSSILTDDLKSQEKEIQELQELILEEEPTSKGVIELLKNAILSGGTGKEGILMESVQNKAHSMSIPVVLALIMALSEDNASSNVFLPPIIESYSSWKKMNDSHKVTEPERVRALYFSHLKELLHMYIKENDKRLMKTLWQDPELIALLKGLMTLMYEPIVKVFKTSRVDLALRSFENFMNELITLIDNIINGKCGNYTQFNVVQSINDLVTRHEDSFFSFVHQVYINDTESIFEGVIQWVQEVLNFLQKSKYGNPEERIDFSQLLVDHKNIINVPLLRKQIDQVVEHKMNSRKLYHRLLNSKTGLEQEKNQSNMLANNWEYINSMVLPQDSLTFGVHANDLLDLDADAGDYAQLKQEGLTTEQVNIGKEYQKLLETQIDESEIEKFTSLVFENTLKLAIQRERDQPESGDQVILH